VLPLPDRHAREREHPLLLRASEDPASIGLLVFGSLALE